MAQMQQGPPQTTQRRTLLKVGLAAGAALAVAGGAAVWMTEPAWKGQALSATGQRVLRAVARAVLEGSLPADAESALSAHLTRMNATLGGMPPGTQAEVNELLTILGTAAGRLGLASLRSDWQDASVAQIQSALQGMRTSSLALRQQAYHALRDLTHAAYFADASTWSALGYPGPNPV
jgi:hypothetical protein